MGGILEIVGSRGWGHVDSLHVAQRVVDDAMNTERLSLEYFRSFHVRHKEALLPHFARTPSWRSEQSRAFTICVTEG